jgi:hypothetical protein
VQPFSFIFDFYVQLPERCKKCTGGNELYSEGKQKSVISRASVLEGKVLQSYYFTFTVSAAELSFHSTVDFV